MDTVNELSIEETNKLREQLGLKKLEVTEEAREPKDSVDGTQNESRNGTHGGSANNHAKNNATMPMMITRSKRNETIKVEVKKEMDTAKPKEKMVTRSSKRKLEQTEQVKPISENFGDDINDVESWVKKTRTVMNQKLAPRVLYSDEEKETKGEKEKEQKSVRRGRKKKETGINKLKVEHNTEDVKEEMILTLKDKPVLDETEEPDCLINEELETQNTKNMLHKTEDNYWNKNYYDPLSYYNEDRKSEKKNSFKLPTMYGDEKHSFEVEVKHEENKTVEKRVGRKRKTEKTEEKPVKQNKVQTTKEIGEEPQNNPPGKKRGRKKSVKGNEPQDTSQNVPKKIPQETNKQNETDCFLKVKKRKIQNINKRKKEDRWGFLFGSDGEEKKDASDKVEKGVVGGKKRGRKPIVKVENGKKIENEEPQTLEPEREQKQMKTSEGEKYKERKKEKEKEKEKDVERNKADVADEIVKALLEDPLDLSFDLGFDGLGDITEDATEVYTLLEKVAELKKKKRENKQKKNLVNYVVVNEKKKSNTKKGGDKTKNTNDDIDDNDEEVQKIQNEIIKLTETSEFCKNILLTTDICASDFEETSRSTRKRGTRENSKRKKNGNDTLTDTNNILKEAINEDVLKNAQIEKETGEDSNENLGNKESDGGVSKLFNEVQLDQGLFGALTYLKTKGELNMEEKIYRNPESRPLHMPTDKDAIKLDYKSETGKVMTPKETFRHISWIFHGKKQGKNKLEKKIKRMEMERRFKENPIDSLPTLNVLKKYQETKKKAYFTLSNKM